MAPLFLVAAWGESPARAASMARRQQVGALRARCAAPGALAGRGVRTSPPRRGSAALISRCCAG